jgi:hypothetical protein
MPSRSRPSVVVGDKTSLQQRGVNKFIALWPSQK